jgi:gas vesicle protein
MKCNIIELGGYAMLAKSIIDRVNVIRNSRRQALRRTRARNLALGASVGTAVGVAAGVLLAPRSGKEIRGEISRRTGDALDSLRNNVLETKNKISASAKNQGSKLRAAAEACADAAKQAVDSENPISTRQKKK